MQIRRGVAASEGGWPGAVGITHNWEVLQQRHKTESKSSRTEQLFEMIEMKLFTKEMKKQVETTCY